MENSKSEKILRLVTAVKNNDTPSFVELLGLFSKSVSAIAFTFHLPESEFEDLCQEGRMALYRAAISFDGSKNASFSTYATVCITNAMVNFVNKYNSTVGNIVNVNVDEEPAVAFSDEAPDGAVYSREFRAMLSTQGFAGLSETERKTVFLKVCGYKTAEISKLTGKSAKSVDNTLFRARKKLRSYIDGTK